MRIDLHAHSAERSPCAVSRAEEMIEAAVAAGLDGIALTDHDRLVPAADLERFNSKYAPFRVFSGIEISLDLEHVVVLGLRDTDLERRRWDWPRLHEFVHTLGGLTILAHPYRFRDAISIDVERCPPDAVEVNSTNMGRCDLGVARALAKALGAWPVANSDAHHRELVGVYHNVFDTAVSNDAELVAALRAGRAKPRRMEKRIAAINKLGGWLQ